MSLGNHSPNVSAPAPNTSGIASAIVRNRAQWPRNRRGLKENDPDGIATAYLAAAARARTRFWLSEAFSSTRL